MSQNRSTAVMQRRVEPPDAADDFPTPPWATRAAVALLESLIDESTPLPLVCHSDVREPCANRGYMVRPLAEAFRNVLASDVHDYGTGYPLLDYLFPGPMVPAPYTFMNSPFNLGPEFILKSFETPGWCGTAALVRTAFLEGQRRYRDLFSVRPPTLIAQFVERVIMHKGILRDPDKLYWDGAEWKKPSTATSYLWLLWVKGQEPRPLESSALAWIPPCRKKLERPGDYDNETIEPTRATQCSSMTCREFFSPE